MSVRDGQEPRDTALWRRYQAALADAAPGRCPAPADLAAWIDGRAGTPEREAVEAHLAGCGDCREAVVLARAAAGDPDTREVAATVWRAGRLAVRPARTRRRTGRLALPRAVGWGLAAAASIAVCVAGYHVGGAVTPRVPKPDPLAQLASALFGEPEAADAGLGWLVAGEDPR